MKILKSIILALLIMSVGCDVDYFDDPNEPSTPPSAGIFNKAVEETITDTRDTWFSGRFTLATMQYWQQSEYGDEDRYGYRESMRETWEDFYYNLENLRIVIQLNKDEKTKVASSAYGSNEGQIACARIMMAYLFNTMADTWGDIPYYSHGSTNPNFEALQLTGESEILAPAYATQAEIYADILNELEEAATTLSTAGVTGFNEGDNIYDGKVDKWVLFANSLRLRIATKIKSANATLAATHIADAVLDGVFTSNDDNATFAYETSDKNASPMYRAWVVDARSDFAISNTIVTLLKGANILDWGGANITTNPFFGISDPRLAEYGEPNSKGEYVGMPVAESSAEAATITWESLPNRENIINKADYAPVLMEYAEVAFLLSEENSWDQTQYVNGITASMEKWGVSAADIATYTGAVPVASEENVLTQKYIALYMDGATAWTEYRRTGYPTCILKPNPAIADGTEYTVFEPTSGKFVQFNFDPIPSEITNDLPTRMEYPDFESTLNEANYLDAVKGLSNGNDLTSKLWWDNN